MTNLCFKNFIYIFTIIFFLCATLKSPQTTSVEDCESRKRRLPPPCSGSHCRDERWGPLAPRPPEGLLRSLGAGMGSSPHWFASFHQGGCVELACPHLPVVLVRPVQLCDLSCVHFRVCTPSMLQWQGPRPLSSECERASQIT